MNVVDSSAWFEYFAGSEYAKHFREVITSTHELIVPSIVLSEVCKKVWRVRGPDDALAAAASMRQGHVIDLDADLALQAASCGVQFHLPMADSIVYATALQHEATVWTMESDFRNLEHVRYFPKNRKV